MASINDYFNIDRKHNIIVESESKIMVNDGTNEFILPIRMFQNLAVGAWYVAVHLPTLTNPLDFSINLIRSDFINSVINALPKLGISSEYPANYAVNTAQLKFCGRIYIYSETDLTEQQAKILHHEGTKLGLFVEYFGPKWAENRSSVEKPLAFICHDSRDKETIARPLALKLSGLGVPVWFDEFSLSIGDSLRESIEKGIRETDFCILIISKHFLKNEGWTKTEFDSVFTREILQKQKLFLPIWDDVTPEEIYNYSPTLLDRLGAKWTEGIEEIAGKIKNKILDRQKK